MYEYTLFHNNIISLLKFPQKEYFRRIYTVNYSKKIYSCECFALIVEVLSVEASTTLINKVICVTLAPALTRKRARRLSHLARASHIFALFLHTPLTYDMYSSDTTDSPPQ